MSAIDVLVIGSGPAGVSAAFPLAEAGFNVVMIDAGGHLEDHALRGDYLTIRSTDKNQWRSFLGDDFYGLRQRGAVSPKLAVPGLAHVFAGYRERYRIETQGNFEVCGSLARGGLSNAWGAGVAAFDANDLADFPITLRDLSASYARVAARIGVSGSMDDLAEFFGDMGDIDPPTPLDIPAATLFENYGKCRVTGSDRRLRLGRSRNAVITRTRYGRNGCAQSALCLWGCAEKSIYNAAYDVPALQRFPNFKLLARRFVDHIQSKAGAIDVIAQHMDTQRTEIFTASKVILAAGAIGTGRLVYDALGLYDVPIRLISNPTAAFALLVPRCIGISVAKKAFSLSQISFVCDEDDLLTRYAFGNIFGTTGLPLREFITRSPVSSVATREIFRLLLPSMLVGNCFLHGSFSEYVMMVRHDRSLTFKGDVREGAAAVFTKLRRTLSKTFRRLGAFMIPGSFVMSRPGSDLHYAGTVPMRAKPESHEANSVGEVAGIPGVFVADSAAFPSLPAKPLTFTAMANADRIATHLANHFR